MRIVFMGSPDSGRRCLEHILEAGHDVLLAITQPDRPAGRGRRMRPPPVKSFAQAKGIPILQPRRIRKDRPSLERLSDLRPDLIVVVAYGQIIPGSIIYLPKYNTINLHYSNLPKYRGASPVQWALLHGETRTGVTIFELDEKMDEGPVYARREVDILPGETAARLEGRLTQIGAELLVETIPRIPKHEPVPQDHSAATYARLIRKHDGKIEWDRPASRIDGQVRAFTPWPSAFTFHQDRRIKLLKGRPMSHKPPLSEPLGSILSIGREGVEVACGGGTAYLIEELQPENKRAMSAYAFSLGVRLAPGDAFG